MDNPSPRPALRKAPDSDIHPAVLVVPETNIDLRGPTLAPVAANSRVDSQPQLSKKQRKAAKSRAGKRLDLRVKVPKTVRQQLRATAKARGTSVDDVVTTVLEGWLDS